MIFLGIFIIILLGVKGNAELKEIIDQKTFIVGLDEHFPPIGFRNESGELVGFDVDMAKEAASRLDMQVKFKPVKWSRIIEALNENEIDIIWNGLTVTEDRKKQLEFSDVYMRNRQVVLANVKSNIKNLGMLTGKIVGYQKGSSSEQILKNDETISKNISFEQFPHYEKALEALLSGEIEALILDEIVAAYYINTNTTDLEIIKFFPQVEEYALGFRKNDEELITKFNKVLKKMKEDGTTSKISRKWFGNDIVVK